ncbi:MaoC/PaaZ C-terminal domain-containing protein [Marinobacter halotolerans]|uniref:MaoC/PaaZ C-terminal domain-containing protein n=1 Tax=Marinobacter halotolerans TaxID=1569211 RepID=UPI00124803F0|nr:MaoC/PaaZ C-terminal domain-containing protein [Marinobacter halotolerans]
MSLSLEALKPGDLVAERVFGPITGDMLVAYAEASGDSNPLHLDRDIARKSGFDDVIIHGMLGMALLGNLLTDAFPQDNLKRFSSRFVSIMPVESIILCRAEMVEKSATAVVLKLEASIDGTDKTVITGSADLSLPVAS